MKHKLALIAATALVTTTIDFKIYKKQLDQATARYTKQATIVGAMSYNLGKVAGKLEAQQKMHHARPVVEETKYVSHTMN